MNLLRERGLKNDAWPESLSNDFDGTIPPLMRLMLRQDAETGAALDTLGPDFDFLDLEPDNDEQFAAMLKVVRGIQALVEDLGGTPVAGDAVSQENQSPKPHEASISNVIPPEVARFVRDWLSEATPVEDGSDKPRQPNNATGWKRDDSLMVLRYVPAGHADAVLVTILEMLARDSGHDITKVQAELAGPGAPGLCRSCHSLEQVDTADGRVLEFQWRGRAPTVTSEITHFQHGPHLQLPGLLECKTCHPLNPDAASATDYLQSDPTHHQPQFLPIQRDACAACHTPQGAGSSCTKCHNYHVGNGPHVEE